MFSPFDWMTVKDAARQRVHDTFAVLALYTDDAVANPQTLSVRWHDTIVLNGDIASQGYAETISGVDTLIFDRTQLDAIYATHGIMMRPGGVITLMHPTLQGVRFVLESREPTDGPREETWNVTRIGEG